MIRLIKPSVEYWQDYLEAMRECQKAGDIIEIQKNAAIALRSFKALEEGRGLPEGIVPCDHFWLLSGRRFIGAGVARHCLNDALERNGGHINYIVRPALRSRGWDAKFLSLLIKECGKHGIKCALITYPESNRRAEEAANRCDCNPLDRISAEEGPPPVIITRCLADTKIGVQTWREPMFKFKDAVRIFGAEVDLELALTIPADRSYCPTYRFNILKSGTRHRVGYIDLRIGFDPEIFCSGNVGYYVDERQRGHGYAAKAAVLLAPLARAHHMRTLTITCNPDNPASAKTAEKLGARYLELIRLPKTSGQYKQGDRYKRRYIWDLGPV
ncbi:MAG: GNAT family N-acetyltransferase [Clostridiales bacterium]|nr:GNAT family N-acetyltransferase [Clostridiales bacterium]